MDSNGNGQVTESVDSSSKRLKTEDLLEVSENNIYSEKDMKVLFKTIVFASLKHSNQRRKDPQKTPYINHPIGVANNLIKNGFNDLITLQAALLHDTLEDTETTFEELVEVFGLQVAEIVKEVTDDSLLPKMERKKLQIQNALNLSLRAKQVRLADKLYNLTDIMQQVPVGWTKERVHEYFIWARNVTNNCLGAAPAIEVQLKKIYSQGQFLFLGELYPCILVLDGDKKEEVETL